MKLTKKTVKKEVETTEKVCEISQTEFDKLCAKTAASVVVDFIGDDYDEDDILASIQLTTLLANFVSELDGVMFDTSSTNENPDKKEEK